MNRCGVAGCEYLAVSAIADCGDFLVCLLHDHPNTKAMLERFERPGAFWVPDGYPIIISVGELAEEHLAPRPARAGAICASESDRLADVPDGESRVAHPRFSLARSA